MIKASLTPLKINEYKWYIRSKEDEFFSLTIDLDINKIKDVRVAIENEKIIVRNKVISYNRENNNNAKLRISEEGANTIFKIGPITYDGINM